MFNLIGRTFRSREKLNSEPMGKAKGTNQTTVGQAYAMVTRKFRDLE